MSESASGRSQPGFRSQEPDTTCIPMKGEQSRGPQDATRRYHSLLAQRCYFDYRQNLLSPLSKSVRHRPDCRRNFIVKKKKIIFYTHTLFRTDFTYPKRELHGPVASQNSMFFLFPLLTLNLTGVKILSIQHTASNNPDLE